MRVRLGRKGYQPDNESPLAAYVKGIGELTDLMQKLSSIIEEDLNEALVDKYRWIGVDTWICYRV